MRYFVDIHIENKLIRQSVEVVKSKALKDIENSEQQFQQREQELLNESSLPKSILNKIHDLFPHEYQRKYHTDHSVAKVESDPKQLTKFRLNIDGLEIYDWFRQKQKELLHSIGINPQEKQSKEMKI